MAKYTSIRKMSSKSQIFVCNKHVSNITRGLPTFYGHQQLIFDVALTTKVDNLTVFAHSTVLSTSSDYFRAMLPCTFKEARACEIELEIDGPTLRLVVDFMYSGTIELHWENVTRILAAANGLKMSTLKVACSDFLAEAIDANNCLSIASVAIELQSAELYKSAFEFALKNFEEVSKKKDFLQLTEEQLSELISSEDLHVDSEETVFQRVLSWVKYDKGHRVEAMMGLLSHVRFSEVITKCSGSPSETYECLEILFSWLESHLSWDKSSRPHSKRRRTNANGSEILGFISGKYTDNLKIQFTEPESNICTCEDMPPSLLRREDYKAMVMQKKLIIAGGRLGGGAFTNIVECLDIQTSEWTNLPPMRQARAVPGMAELNGELYILGGKSYGNWLRSVEKFNFRTREWQELPPMNSTQNAYARVTVLGGILYAVGDGSSPIECFSPAHNKWTQIPDKNEKSTRYGIAGVGGYLYAVGGTHSGQRSSTVERFDPSKNSWTVIRSGLGLALSGLICVTFNNRLVVCRGYDNQRKVENSVLEYSPEDNVWRTMATLVKHDLVHPSCSIFTFTK